MSEVQVQTPHPIEQQPHTQNHQEQQPHTQNHQEQQPQPQNHHHHHNHHQRAPRTPESYFNVPESIALLNIVKSDRIQSAFQSNRKNHASVWEMVAEILSRYNNRKRSAKQCCNRYENLKKIYTQLKRNPEKHVRRNWPYMYLFRQIEEQRGESWGSSAAKRRTELSYYQRRRALMLMNNNNNNSDNLAGIKDPTALLKLESSIVNNNNNHIDIKNAVNNGGGGRGKEQPLFMPNQFMQTEMRDCDLLNRNLEIDEQRGSGGGGGGADNTNDGGGMGGGLNDAHRQQGLDLDEIRSAIRSSTSSQLNLDTFDFGGLIHVKEEPPEADYDDQDRGLSFGRINNNYNGQPASYMNGHHHYHNNGANRGGIDNNDGINGDGCNGDMENDNETNILHPDVIVDTDHVTDSSTSNHSIINIGSKRKISTSSDEDDDSTNYELIEYLKRREKRDELMLKRMEEREERLLKLLERTVVAIENIASHNCNQNQSNNNNNSCNSSSSKNTSNLNNNNNLMPNHK